MTVKLNTKQLRVLQLADVSGAWFMPDKKLGPIVGGLTNRGLINSRLNHNRDRQIRVTPAGRTVLEAYGIDSRSERC
ncbi:MAG TPA: hypothetical protein VIG47_03090 [Gemmatimonadaceae bacterium]|jgi:hypothetical protein